MTQQDNEKSETKRRFGVRSQRREAEKGPPRDDLRVKSVGKNEKSRAITRTA